MATFAPPEREGNRMEGPPTHPLNRLFRFYGSWAQGATVWKDSLGAWHESTTPYLGGAVHATHNWNGSTYTAPDAGLATAQVVYDGGHVHTISEAAADELEAAGFGSGILTRQSILETFTGPDSQPPGPDLDWAEEVFDDQPYDAATFNNQLWYHTDAPGTWEEILVPTPNVDSPNVTATVPLAQLQITGTGNHQVGMGVITRYETINGGTYYRGYGFEVSRSNILFPGIDLWLLIIWRVEGPSASQIFALDIDTAPFANVTLPGTLTITANGPNLSSSFTHGGVAPTLTASATDSMFTTGKTVLGFGHVQSGTEVATTVIDSFQAGPA